MNDPKLEILLAKARSVWEAEGAGEPAVSPPGWARGVVQRWQAGAETAPAESWLLVSRRGLAVALGLMVASVLWQVRAHRSPVLMESAAYETVVMSIVPE